MNLKTYLSNRFLEKVIAASLSRSSLVDKWSTCRKSSWANEIGKDEIELHGTEELWRMSIIVKNCEGLRRIAILNCWNLQDQDHRVRSPSCASVNNTVARKIKTRTAKLQQTALWPKPEAPESSLLALPAVQLRRLLVPAAIVSFFWTKAAKKKNIQKHIQCPCLSKLYQFDLVWMWEPPAIPSVAGAPALNSAKWSHRKGNTSLDSCLSSCSVPSLAASVTTWKIPKTLKAGRYKMHQNDSKCTIHSNTHHSTRMSLFDPRWWLWERSSKQILIGNVNAPSILKVADSGCWRLQCQISQISRECDSVVSVWVEDLHSLFLDQTC